MLTLPADLILEKNRVASNSPWLILLEVSVSTSTLSLVRNTEDIVYNSTTYTAFPFEIDSTQQTSKGEIPSLSLRVCNINQVMQSYIETYDGLIGNVINIKIVSKPENGSSYLLAASVTYNIVGCEADSNWVTWTLGAPNPLFKRFPLDRYLANHCNWVGRFNTAVNVECGVYSAGSTITCNGTLTDCATHSNTDRFGGYVGLGKGNVRLV